MSRPILAEYCAAGFALVPIPPGEKGPIAKGWNLRDHCITDPYISEVLDGNVGLAHAYSGTACLDLDQIDDVGEGDAIVRGARWWFTQRGVNLDDWLGAPDAVMILSGRENRAKLLYRVDKPVPSFKLPGFELRCATSKGTTVQDVLPPSIHPVTQQPYVWAYGDELFGHWSALPEMPEALAAIWKGMIRPENALPKNEERTTVGNVAYAKSVLADHTPDEGYDHWLKMGLALHYEFDGHSKGLQLWDQWSQPGKTYKGLPDLEPHWRSFSTAHDNPVTLASFRVSKAASPDDFEIVAPVVSEQSAAARTLAAAQRATPATMKEALNLLKRDKQGVLNTLPNVITVLAIPEVTRSQISYDSFKDMLMTAPGGTDEWRPIQDTDYTAMRVWLENIGNFHPVSKDMVRDAVHYIGVQHQMDTAQKWLASLKWDGVPRIDTFMPRYMGTIDATYERSVGKYLWTALAGRIMAPGCQVDMVPILVGKQGKGKSQGVKALVPNKDFYVEIRLDEPDDSIARKMRGTLVGELAELRGLRTTDLDRIKAFVTRTDEKWTPKYMEFATTFSRRLVMIGTTNEDEFLVDDENRRWLPVRTAGVNVAAIARDRDQLWAEAMEIWLAEGIHWEQAEQLAKVAQADYVVEDNWLALVRTWLVDNGAGPIRIYDVLLQAIGLGPTQVNRTHELRAGKILRELGYHKTVTKVGNISGKFWVHPKRPQAVQPDLDDLLA